MYKRFSDSTKILLATRGTLREPFIKKLVLPPAVIADANVKNLGPGGD